MLLPLFEYLSEFFGPFRVVAFLSTRAILATLTSLLFSLFLGPKFINKMKCDCADGNDCYIGINKSCSPSKNNRSQKIHMYYKAFIHILNSYVHVLIFNKRRLKS